MNKLYYSAPEAMRAAYEMSQLLRKAVYRHMGLDKRGVVCWVVSFEKNAQAALQSLVA